MVINKTAVIISVAIPIPTFAFGIAPQQSKKVPRREFLARAHLSLSRPASRHSDGVARAWVSDWNKTKGV
jgi:hypothetical protein